jgi:hypothetical protein
MKRTYMKPDMKVVLLKHRTMLLNNSVKDTYSNASIRYSGSDENYYEDAR